MAALRGYFCIRIICESRFFVVKITYYLILILMTKNSDYNLSNPEIHDVMELFDDGKPEPVDHQRAALIAACKEAEANRTKAMAVTRMQGGKPMNLENLA